MKKWTQNIFNGPFLVLSEKIEKEKYFLHIQDDQAAAGSKHFTISIDSTHKSVSFHKHLPRMRWFWMADDDGA